MLRGPGSSSCLPTIALCLSLFAIGCGGGAVSTPVEPPPPPPAKAMLEAVAQTGELGSGAETIREALTTQGASDLLKDLDELEKLSNPAQIKAKAKAMAEKL